MLTRTQRNRDMYQIDMNRQEKSVCDILSKIGKTNADNYLFSLCDNILSALKGDSCLIFEINKNNDELYPFYFHGNGENHLKLNPQVKIPKGKGIAGWTALYEQPLFINNTANDSRYLEELKYIYHNHTVSRKRAEKSILAVPLIAFGTVLGVLEVIRNDYRKFSSADLISIQPFNSMIALGIQHKNTQGLMQLAEVCIRFLEERDRYTHGHSLRVMQYSLVIAEEMHLDEPQKQDLKLCATLHDIGKITLKDSILKKHSNTLSKIELQAIRMHTIIGFHIVSNINKSLARVILSHHEHYDGTGYPHMLKGDEIPLLGRIICLTDTFDAMTTDRPYRKAIEVPLTIAELTQKSATQFDPAVVDAFLSAYRNGKINLVTPYRMT